MLNSKKIGLIAGCVLVLGTASCSKHAGSGGNSAIRGLVTGYHTGSGDKDPSAEVTTVTFTEGAAVDDNDYWLLNSAGGNQYYIWYDNTNWVGGDPVLTGRTGIKVVYDFYNTNSEMAANTLAQLNAMAGADFTFSIDNDIIVITDKQLGFVVDAEDMTTPFAIDVSTQGKSGTSGTSGYNGPMVDQRVYLIYDDEEYYSESVRTDDKGEYEFKGLRKGNYRIFAFSKDTLSNTSSRVEVTAEIGKNKSIVSAPDIVIID